MAARILLLLLQLLRCLLLLILAVPTCRPRQLCMQLLTRHMLLLGLLLLWVRGWALALWSPWLACEAAT